MRKILVDNIKGNEKLAKSIFTENDIILISEGVVIQRSYIDKLKQLNIDYIYVEDDLSRGIFAEDITEIQIKEQCQSVVAETINRYAYSGNEDFRKLQDVSREIIEDMLEQPEVMFNISGVRQKSERIYAHSLNVCALSVLIALRMGLPKHKIEEIAVGSVLHDIGFCNVPMEIRNMEYHNYTEKEMKAIRMHVVEGYSIIEKQKWLKQSSKEIIFAHHERENGSGYPLRLNGDRLRVGTKIVAVCDEFDNLVYGNFSATMKVHDAMEYIVSGAGRIFDYEVIRIFNESVAAYPIGTMVLTNENEIGIVLRQNSKCPTRPVIRILKDKSGKPKVDWEEKDLTKELTLFIKDTIEE